MHWALTNSSSDGHASDVSETHTALGDSNGTSTRTPISSAVLQWSLVELASSECDEEPIDLSDNGAVTADAPRSRSRTPQRTPPSLPTSAATSASDSRVSSEPESHPQRRFVRGQGGDFQHAPEFKWTPLPGSEWWQQPLHQSTSTRRLALGKQPRPLKVHSLMTGLGTDFFAYKASSLKEVEGEIV
jgi:hypothetical protein